VSTQFFCSYCGEDHATGIERSALTDCFILFLITLYHESKFQSIANSTILGINVRNFSRSPGASQLRGPRTTTLVYYLEEFGSLTGNINLQPGGAAGSTQQSPATQSSLGSINLAETLAFSNSLSLSCINIVISKACVKSPGKKYMAEISRSP